MVCDFSPVAFHAFGFPIHWYSLAYIFGILSALFLARHLCAKVKDWAASADPAYSARFSSIKDFQIPSEADLENFLSYAIIGIILGGRLGHVLFYDFEYYSTHPMEILRVWKGGMSFFGGFIGSVSFAALFCCIKRINFWRFADFWSVGVPIGLGLGRIVNLINGELLGKETTVPFGVIFSDGILRHPSQIYEAFSEGLLLFCIMIFSFYKLRLFLYKGALSGVFCMGYGVARFICEIFRESDSLFSEKLLIETGLNLNQYMSIGIFVLGLILLWRSAATIKSENKDGNNRIEN